MAREAACCTAVSMALTARVLLVLATTFTGKQAYIYCTRQEDDASFASLLVVILYSLLFLCALEKLTLIMIRMPCARAVVCSGGVGGLPVGGAVRARGDHPRGAVRPRGRGGEQCGHGHVPLRRVPARWAVRVAGARQGPGLPLQVLGLG